MAIEWEGLSLKLAKMKASIVWPALHKEMPTQQLPPVHPEKPKAGGSNSTKKKKKKGKGTRKKAQTENTGNGRAIMTRNSNSCPPSSDEEGGTKDRVYMESRDFSSFEHMLEEVS